METAENTLKTLENRMATGFEMVKAMLKEVSHPLSSVPTPTGNPVPAAPAAVQSAQPVTGGTARLGSGGGDPLGGENRRQGL